MRPKIEDMCPELQEKFGAFSARMAEAGVPFVLGCVLRVPAEQTAYFAQGRQPLAEVNRLRKAAGMSPIGPKDNAYKVTWTMNSRHFPNAEGKATAFDIIILRGAKRQAHWDIKWDDDKDTIPDYEEAARIGESVGLEAGARWKQQDWPHFQLKKVKT